MPRRLSSDVPAGYHLTPAREHSPAELERFIGEKARASYDLSYADWLHGLRPGGVERTPAPRAPDRVPPRPAAPAARGGGGGISNAEFNRFVQYMSGQFLGGPALLRHLFGDIGSVDVRGRPLEGRTLWWFLAHLDPTDMAISTRREQLYHLIEQVDSQPAARRAVVSLALAYTGEARRLLNSSIDAVRVCEFDGEDGEVAHDVARRLLLQMLEAAEAAVVAWSEKPRFVGNDYFMARAWGGDELTYRQPGRDRESSRRWFTLDDEIVAVAAPLAKRIASFGDSTPGRAHAVRARRPK